MTNSGDLVQLYILLSYEKLQRAAISQRQRPVEASLRNRLLVWRFLKKIENEPMTLLQADQGYLSCDSQSQSDENSWFVDLNGNYADEHSNLVHDEDVTIDMDIESDLMTVVNSDDLNDSTCETMNIDPQSDVTLFFKRAIGAERRQKISSDCFHSDENLHQCITDNTTYEETEQFFHDLCTELTNTTAALVSSTALNFTPSPEQTLIH